VEDKKISEAVELLYKGAKMLSYYCPECKVPLFKDKDRVFCPSCKRDVVFESDDKFKYVKQDLKVENRVEFGEKEIKQVIQSNELEEVFKDAISNLALKLKNVEDTENLKEIVELIDKLTNLIEKLKRLKYI